MLCQRLLVHTPHCTIPALLRPLAALAHAPGPPAGYAAGVATSATTAGCTDGSASAGTPPALQGQQLHPQGLTDSTPSASKHTPACVAATRSSRSLSTHSSCSTAQHSLAWLQQQWRNQQLWPQAASATAGASALVAARAFGTSSALFGSSTTMGSSAGAAGAFGEDGVARTAGAAGDGTSALAGEDPTSEVRAITRMLRDSQELQQLQQIVQQAGSSFNAIHTAAAFSRASQLAGDSPAAAEPLLQLLAPVWLAVVSQATLRELANVAMACGKLGCSNEQLWSSIVSAFLQQHQQAVGKDLEQVVRSLAAAAAANNGSVPGVPREQVQEVCSAVVQRMVELLSGPAADEVGIKSVFLVLQALKQLGIQPQPEHLAVLRQRQPHHPASVEDLELSQRVYDSSSVAELEDIVSDWGDGFDSFTAAAAFGQAASLAQHVPAAAKQLLDRLAIIWQSVLPEADATSLGVVMSASGRLQYTNIQLWSSTLPAFFQQLQSASCRDIASAMHGIAALAAANKGNVPGMSRAEMINQVQVLVTHLRLESVAPQDIVSVLWSCAKLHIKLSSVQLCSLLQAMARPAVLEKAEPQHLATVLYAVSELQQQCSWQPPLNRQEWQQLLVAGQLKKIADSGTPQHVSTSLMAVARISSGTVPAISKQLAQECAVQLLGGSVAQQLDGSTAQAVANSMWAVGKLDLHGHEFLLKAAAAAPGWLATAIAPNLTQSAWSCATLQFEHPQLLADIMQRSQYLLQQRGGDQLVAGDAIGLSSTVGWAAAVLDVQHLAGEVKALTASSGVGQHKEPLHPACADRLWAVHSWLLQHQLLDGQGLAGLLSAQQLAVCEAAAAGSQAAQESRSRDEMRQQRAAAFAQHVQQLLQLPEPTVPFWCQQDPKDGLAPCGQE